MTSLVVLLSCLAENLELLWEKKLVFEAPEKHSLGHLRAVKQLKTVALDLEEVRELILRPQSIQLHISRIFHVSKQTSASC